MRAALSLEYPRSLGVYDEYADAQKAVDYLSDHEFPVQNVLIVGTDLKQLERVTGRLTRGKVAMGGVLSGAWLGFFVGMVFTLFGSGSGNAVVSVLSTVVFGAVFGVVWAMITFRITNRGGDRDFTSVSQVVATRYEVLTEHKVADQARQMLAEMDPMRAAQAQVDEARRQESMRSQAHQPQQPPNF